jgi:hypothetical protein
MGELIHLIEKHVQPRGSNGENMRVYGLLELVQADIVAGGVVPKTGAISLVFKIKSRLKQLHRTKLIVSLLNPLYYLNLLFDAKTCSSN